MSSLAKRIESRKHFRGRIVTNFAGRVETIDQNGVQQKTDLGFYPGVGENVCKPTTIDEAVYALTCLLRKSGLISLDQYLIVKS